MADRPRSRRCSVCDTNWPFTPDYMECPLGHGPTWVAGDEQPLSDFDAKKHLKRLQEFEQYYEDREDRQISEAVAELLDSIA